MYFVFDYTKKIAVFQLAHCTMCKLLILTKKAVRFRILVGVKATADMGPFVAFARRHIVRVTFMEVKRGNRPPEQTYVNCFNKARGQNGSY